MLEGGLRLDLGPEELQDGVDEAATLCGIEAERGGIERGGEEALLGEGTKAAGGLGLKDARAALQDAVGWGWDGRVVGECVQNDGRREWLCGSDVGGLARFQREVSEYGRRALVAVGGVPRVAEEHGGSAGGDALGDAAGVSGVACGVGAGHGEFALQQPRQQRIRAGCGRPGEVVGAEEPEGVEAGAGGLERPHDLDRRVAGLGGKEGFGGDALERG